MTTRTAAEALEKLIRLERALEKKCHDLGYYNMIHVGLREFVEHAATLRAALAQPQEGEVEECAKECERKAAVYESYTKHSPEAVWFLAVARLLRATQSAGRDEGKVFFYEREFYPLSNFSSFKLAWSGLVFDTSEAAYQWEKFPSAPNLQAAIMHARSAHEAFKLAEASIGFRRDDWEAVRVDIMRAILMAKANQHEYVKRKLLETGDRELIEDSWRDNFWGWGPNRDGENMLGKLWMEVRASLRATQSNDPGGWQERERVLYGESPAQSAPAQEPVAWRIQLKDGYLYGGNLEEMLARHNRLETLDPGHSLLEPNPIAGQPEPLYAAPPQDEARELRKLVAEQAEDDGLWFEAQTAPEAYLQQQLRLLHEMVEKHK